MFVRRVHDFASGRAKQLCLIPAPVNGLSSVAFQTIGALTTISLVTSRSAQRARVLLGRFRVSAGRVDFRRRGARRQVPRLVRLLGRNGSVTRYDSTNVPSVSSPNQRLITTTITTNLRIITLPNTGTKVATLVTSNLGPRPFCFCNFLDHGRRRRVTRLAPLGRRRRAVVFCRTPRQLTGALDSVTRIFKLSHGTILTERLAGHCRRFYHKSLRRLVR